MKVKYNNQETFHNIDEYIFVNIDRVRLTGEGALDNTSGFDVYNDDEAVIYLNSEHTVIYEKGENFVEYTKDQNVYYDFYVANENGFVTGIQVFKSPELPEGIIGVPYKEGQGKEFVEPTTDLAFVDEEGFPNFKIVDGNMVEVSAEEKAEMRDAKREAEFESALNAKLAELSSICAENIVAGIDYNGQHYSYEITDQNNIESAVSLATATGLEVPYHAEGETCRLYTPDEIIAIYVTCETNLTHNITYYNQLKLYTQTLTTKEDVNNVAYGQMLQGEYLDTYVMIMAQSKKIIAAYLNTDEATVDAILGKSATMAAALN